MFGETVLARDYQDEADEAVNEAWSRGVKRVAVVIPTQGGKTLAAFAAVLGHMQLGVEKALFIVHRRKIVEQTVASITKMFEGMDVGMVMGDVKEWNNDVLVGTVQTIHQNLDKLPDIDYLIVDEAHHAQTNSQYRDIITHLDTKTLFISATIEERHQLDKLDVKLVYHDADDERLVKAGILAETKVEYVPIPDAHTLFKLWREKSGGQRCLIFAESVNKARHIARYFQTVGAWRTVAVDANSSDKQRRYAEVDADVVVNKGLYLEGADLKRIGVVFILGRDQHATQWVQKIGRAKKADGTGCLVIANSLKVKRDLPLEVKPCIKSPSLRFWS